MRFREVQGGLPLTQLSLEQALHLARALRTRLMQDDAPPVGWPLLPLPVATLAQLLLCPWWHTDPPRTWTWRVYHGNQPLGRWSAVGFNEGGVLAAGPCLRPLPSLPAICKALSAFEFECKHGVSTRTLLPDYLREAWRSWSAGRVSHMNRKRVEYSYVASTANV